ncbi:MAG: hypothetical protein U1E54_02115 [Candidatus Levybacteria bacterium]|nr:hypothetical protein [Candidatus Levybacteria bacterium]
MHSIDYNIEFAHIYVDDEFSAEQVESIEILRNLIVNLSNQEENFVTTILIDDYNPKENILDENDLINKIKSFNIPLDFIAYESKLNQVADKLIADLPQTLLRVEGKKNIFLEINNKSIKLRDNLGFLLKNTCTLLTASWLLCRLGKYRLPDGAIRNLSGKTFEASRIVTILPEKYRKSESRALDIIRALGNHDLLKHIEYRFFNDKAE